MIYRYFSFDGEDATSNSKAEFILAISQITEKKSGRILGIDLGTKRIGLAVSDETLSISTPKNILFRQNNFSDFEKILEIISEYKITAIVLGYPLHLDKSVIEMTVISEEFAKKLDELLEKKLPIFLFEERLSSFEARAIAKSGLSRKKSRGRNHNFVDDIAASLILQHFLDDLAQHLI